MSDFATFSNTVVTFVATYFVHSTLLLAMCWLILTLARPKSHFLAERMWKLATVLGILTAFAQLLVGPKYFHVAMQSPGEDVRASAALISPNELGDATAEKVVFGATSVWHRQEVETLQELSESVIGPRDDEAQVVYLIDQPFAESEADSPRFEDPLDTSQPIFAPTDEPIPSALDANSAKLPDEAQFATNSTQKARTWLPVLLQSGAIVLVCAFVVGGLLLILQTTRLRLRFGRGRVLRTGTARTALDRFLKRHKIRGRIRLLSSNKHCEPIAYGLFRWTIVLPEGTEERLERTELKALLAHEVAHLVRGDVRWLWVGRVLCTCCAFQPLNFLARRRWQQAAEYLCDDWAIERGVRSLALARCLTRVAEWRFGAETSEIGLAAGGSKATLVQRVRRLVDEQPPSDVWKSPWRRRALTMGAAVAVVVLVGFAPRVALPLTPVGERASDANLKSIEALVDEPTTSDWHALEEELLQLEADLSRVEQLRDGTNESTEVAANFQKLHRRAASLRARREYITSLIKKESQR
ncbi:MAG: M56 family metallopeptidase [Planctomycetes bacterium]|nr:M56 family metallopeptidase [Planctomycetota bacterium]